MNTSRTLAATFAAVAAFSLLAAAQQPGGAVTSFYDLKTTTLDGKPANLGQYRGKVSLVVNVASKCGYSPSTKGWKRCSAR